MPPFEGPRATLCVTRYPWNTRVVPSSIDTGTETESAFLHSCRTLTRFGSIANVSATFLSCDLAISNGFSRRCETGASTVVTSAPFSAQMRAFLLLLGGVSLLDRETDRSDRRRPGLGREGHQPELVVAFGQDGPCLVATGHPERIATRQDIAQARQQSDAAALRAPQLEVEAGQRQHDRLTPRTSHRAGDEAQQRRRGIRGRERAHRESNRAESRREAWAERDRPRHANLPAGCRRDDDDAFRLCRAHELARHSCANMDSSRSSRAERQMPRPEIEPERRGSLAGDTHLGRQDQAAE